MEKLLIVLCKIINFHEIKNILLNKKKKTLNNYYLKAFLWIIIINLIIFLPLFFLNNIILAILFLIILNLIYFLIIYIRSQLILNRIEQNDKKILSYSLIKTDFINSIKDDIISNLQFSLLLSVLILIYQNLIFLPLSIIFKTGYIKSIVANLSYTACLSIIIHLSLLLYYFRNRKIKYIFSRSKKKTNLISNVLIFFTVFAFSFIIMFIILNHFFDNLILIFLINLFSSAVITLSVKIIFDFLKLKPKLKKSYSFIEYLKKSKSFFIWFKINNFADFFKIIKILYPFISVFLFFILLTVLSKYIKFSFNFKLIQSILLGLILINPSLYFLNKNKENYGNALILTKFIIILIFLINFISLIKLNILFKHDNILFLLKDFVLPIINFINNLSSFINNIIKQINFLIILLIPILFAIIYFSMFYLLLLLEFIGKIIDFKLRRSLTNKNVSIIFGDSISLYPFIFKLFINLLIIIILYLEILPVSRFFSNIFTTFKVAEVFKFNFLEETKIIYFFTVLFYIYTIFLTFNLFLKLISSLNSHFILFNDEIVYYENKLFHKTILRIPIKKINYIVVKQNILEKLLNIGSIYIETLNKNNLIKIPGISFIKEKNILIMEKIKSAL